MRTALKRGMDEFAQPEVVCPLRLIMSAVADPESPLMMQIHVLVSRGDGAAFVWSALTDAVNTADDEGTFLATSLLKTWMRTNVCDGEMVRAALADLQDLLGQALHRNCHEWGEHGAQNVEDFRGLLLSGAVMHATTEADLFEQFRQFMGVQAGSASLELLRWAQLWNGCPHCCPRIRGCLTDFARRTFSELGTGTLERPFAVLGALVAYLPEARDINLVKILLDGTVVGLSELRDVRDFFFAVENELGDEEGELRRLCFGAAQFVETVEGKEYPDEEVGRICSEILRFVLVTARRIDHAAELVLELMGDGQHLLGALLRVGALEQTEAKEETERLDALLGWDGSTEPRCVCSLYEIKDGLRQIFVLCESLTREVEGASEVLAAVAAQYPELVAQRCAQRLKALRNGPMAFGRECPGWWLDAMDPICLPPALRRIVFG
jgi:hypothetical protein